MKSEIELDGEVLDLSAMRQDERDNLILELSILRGMARQQIGKMLGIRKRDVNGALKRALAAQADLPVSESEAAILRLKIMLKGLQAGEPTPGRVDSITRIERLLAKFQGYDDPRVDEQRMIVNIYGREDDPYTAKTISGGGVEMYFEEMDRPDKAGGGGGEALEPWQPGDDDDWAGNESVE